MVEGDGNLHPQFQLRSLWGQKVAVTEVAVKLVALMASAGEVAGKVAQAQVSLDVLAEAVVVEIPFRMSQTSLMKEFTMLHLNSGSFWLEARLYNSANISSVDFQIHSWVILNEQVNKMLFLQKLLYYMISNSFKDSCSTTPDRKVCNCL
ncbi:Protein of unknown function, partial [Gryllus bimaculatus]